MTEGERKIYHAVNLRPWGSGGFGDLRIGWCPELAQDIVVKYLREPHLPDALKAFRREVRILSKENRGCVRILFWNLEAKWPWYAMPFLPGGMLTQWAGRLPADRLHNVAVEIALAVSGLHDQFVIHGDLKPDNILIDGKGRLNVADPLGSGIGCTFLFSEHRGGTFGYMAPEIARGGVITQASDVFSYGATMYHLATGLQPRDKQSLDPVANGFVVSPELRDVIVNCCHQDPALRPSMKDVLRMLNGERLATIRAKRRETVQNFVLAGIAVVGVFAVINALTDAA